MAAPILPISPASIASIPVTGFSPSSARGSGGAFQDVFAAAVQQVETQRTNATDSIQRFLGGEGEELHTTILAAQQAELSFELFLQARNKVVNAYQEIMRMQM
jgi:flagellar hook-basal body complex protein FliE